VITSPLVEIQNPIKEELKKFDDLFKRSLKSNVSIVDLIAKYILRQKGKKIRPLLVLLSGKIAGQISDKTYRGAILVELLHTATLVHDDVVDNAEKRRGLPSINAIWKNKVAVLMGDYLLSRGLMIAVENKDFEALEIITNTVKRMSEGELLQIGKTRKLDIDEETYFRIISDKTASLISTCCEIGAISVNANPEQREAMKKFGECLGISFQIRDDILDYIGTKSLIGKPLGGDIKERKLTLPLIYSLANTDKNKASDILKIIKNSKKNGRIKDVVDFVKESNGIEYAIESAKKYSNIARENLQIFADSPSKAALEKLVDFVLERKN
jgi:octaprenyl-diphosphate synthase